MLMLFVFCAASRANDIDEHVPEEPRLSKYGRGRK